MSCCAPLRMMMSGLLIGLLGLPAVVVGQVDDANAGMVDTGFGTEGYSRPVLPNGIMLEGTAMRIHQMKVQPDGKIVLAGGRNEMGSSFMEAVVVRLNADGSLDTDFGNNGLVGGSHWGGYMNGARFVEVLTDGRLMVAGGGGGMFSTVRLEADGAVDANYNSYHMFLGGWDPLRGYAVQSNGQGIALCQLSEGMYVYRLTVDGVEDITFAGTGRAQPGWSTRSRAGALLVMPDDKIVVGMNESKLTTSWTAETAVSFQRLLADGTLDLTFRGFRNGFPRRDFSPTAKERVKHLGLDAENNLLALCEIEGEPDNVALLRITPEGSFDGTWGSQGAVITRIGEGAIPLAVQSQADGRVLVLAQETAGGVPGNCFLARYLWNGLPDPDFGEGGVCEVRLNVSGAAFAGMHQKEGRILLAATAAEETLPGGETLVQGPLVVALHAGAALPAPAITIENPPKGQDLTMLDPLNLNVAATGPEGMVYTWYRNGKVIQRGFQPDYHVNYTEGVDEGSYRVEVRHGATVVRSEPVNVAINQAAQIQPPWDVWGIEGSMLEVSFSMRARKPMTVRWFKDGVEILEETYQEEEGPPTFLGQISTVTLTLNPLSFSDAGEYHIEVTNADGTVPSGEVRVAVGDDPTVEVLDFPGGYVISVGESLSLQPAFYSSEEYKTQWYKNGKVMTGQRGETLEISEASLKDAGIYTVRMTNSLGKSTSTPMAVSVADTRGRRVLAEGGKKVSLGFPVKDNGIQYEWYHGDELMEDGDGITGSRSGLLNIKSMTKAHEGEYYCLLTQGGTEIVAGYYRLEIVTVLPRPAEVTLPAGQIGIYYEAPLELPVDADQLEVRGLPPGLVYSAEDHHISGHPAKAGSYLVRLTARNLLGKSAPQEVSMVVAPFREERTGRFYGILTGGESQGSLDVTVTSRGSYSGKLTVTTLQGVTLKQAIRGVFQNQAAPNPYQPEVVPVHLETFGLKNPRVKLEDLTPALDLKLDDSVLEATLVIGRKGESDVTEATCLPCPWTAKNPLPQEAPGVYNLHWLTGGEVGGFGHGRATIAASGSLKLTGRLVDGTAFTLAAPMSAELNCKGFSPLYGGRGAVTASYLMELGMDGPSGAEPGLYGDMYWAKRLENGHGQKVHPYNFDCEMEMPVSARYLKPGQAEVTGPLVMNAPSGEDNVELDLMGLAIVEMTLKPNQSLDIANETEDVAGLKSLSFKAATGLFTGRGVLDTYEEKYDPRTDGTRDVRVPRPYTVMGIVIRAPGWRQGTAQGFGLKPVLIHEGEAAPVRSSIPLDVSIVPKGYGDE